MITVSARLIVGRAYAPGKKGRQRRVRHRGLITTRDRPGIINRAGAVGRVLERSRRTNSPAATPEIVTASRAIVRGAKTRRLGCCRALCISKFAAATRELRCDKAVSVGTAVKPVG